MSTRGTKRTVSYEEVIEYRRHHPKVFQLVIAKHFGLTQGAVSKILRAAGIHSEHRGGNRPKRKPSMNELQHAWEVTLHDEGLGMDRGLKLNDQRIHYGFDPWRQQRDQESATSSNLEFSDVE